MINITTLDELDDFIWTSVKSNKVTVLYFGASWCGPCHKFKDHLKSATEQDILQNLAICYIDVDECSDIVSTYNVSSLPSLYFVSLCDNDVNYDEQNDIIIGYNWEKFINKYNSYV